MEQRLHSTGGTEGRGVPGVIPHGRRVPYGQLDPSMSVSARLVMPTTTTTAARALGFSIAADAASASCARRQSLP